MSNGGVTSSIKPHTTMHSRIYQISTEPYNENNGYFLDEDNVMDYNAHRMDYARNMDVGEMEEAVKSLAEDVLPKGMFTPIFPTEEDWETYNNREESDNCDDWEMVQPPFILRYNGGYEEWVKQYVEKIQTLARELTTENVIGWRSKSNELDDYITNPFDTPRYFCDLDSLCGEPSIHIMEIVKHLQAGDNLYIINVLDYHW